MQAERVARCTDRPRTGAPAETAGRTRRSRSDHGSARRRGLGGRPAGTTGGWNIVPPGGTPLGHGPTSATSRNDTPLDEPPTLAGRVRPCDSDHLAGLRRAAVDGRAEAVAAMTATSNPQEDGAGAAPAVTAVGQIAINTSDLDRFRTFYEGLLGLPQVISLRMGQPPHLRYGVFAVGPDTALLAFEVPGYDPVADGIGVETGRRGRIDHFALRVDEAAFSDVRDRLVAAGASHGAVTELGPFRSVPFRDPDGLEGSIICPNRAFDPTQVDDELIECSNPQWTANVLQR